MWTPSSPGCGRKESEVKELLYKFATMRGMMMELGQQQGLLGKIPGLKQFNRMRKMAGMDMDQVMDNMQGFMPPPEGEAEGGKKFRPPRRAADRTKAKNKRKAARAARKKTKKRK